MRVPMVLGPETINPYLATRAVLLLARHGILPAGEPLADLLRTIAFPGMGTGVGRVPAETCARQMRAAVDEFLLDGYRMPKSWAEARGRHQLLYTDRPRAPAPPARPSRIDHEPEPDGGIGVSKPGSIRLRLNPA
jgi:hypothetical protein